jgi:hypothetical protein
MFSDVDFSCPARVYQAVIQGDGQRLYVQLSSVREDLLLKWHKDICNEVITAHFDASRSLSRTPNSSGFHITVHMNFFL